MWFNRLKSCLVECWTVFAGQLHCFKRRKRYNGVRMSCAASGYRTKRLTRPARQLDALVRHPIEAEVVDNEKETRYMSAVIEDGLKPQKVR
jgi:hypothetical protein